MPIDLLRAVEERYLKPDLPEFGPGDTVRVHVKIVEGARERTQVFEGVVMRQRHGGLNQSFTVRRVTHGIGVERTFLIHSPRVERVEIVRRGRVRRAQLYYLRGLSGKAARIKERRARTPAAAAPSGAGAAAGGRTAARGDDEGAAEA
jgi:large subunit ribosomal protein L19